MPDKFIQRVARGEIPNFTVDLDHPGLRFASMDIYSRPGTKVTYMGENGSEADLRYANEHLKLRQLYTIERTRVSGWHTDVYLVEVPGKYFNSVHFTTEPQS